MLNLKTILQFGEVTNNIKYRFQRTFQVARRAFVKDVWTKKALNISYNFPAEVNLERGAVHLLMLEIKVDKGSFEFILDSYHHLRNLRYRVDANFYFENGQFFVQVSDIKLNLTTAEEVFIASEIFLAGIYKFFASGRFVVVDIGTNVGFAALFFAANPDVSQVYCFEPFRRTFDQALRNFQYNPCLLDKIRCFNYGLNEDNRQLSVDFNYENKGQLGIYGTALIQGKVGTVDKADIQLKQAFSELSAIRSYHPNESLMLKIDCEGAEYGIVKNLCDNDFLRHVRVLCIEWHEKGPDELVQSLMTSGFSVFSPRSADKNVGMIYAIR